MANGAYNRFKADMLKSAIPDLSSAGVTIKCAFIDVAAYTVNLTTHDFLDDIPSGARIATATLSNKSVSSDGKWNADDLLTGDVADTEPTIEALVLYYDTGVEGTSLLLYYIDTVSSGLPVTPNGGPIKVQWDNVSNEIFHLGG